MARNAKTETPAETPAPVTPRMLSAEFALTPQRVRKILRRTPYFTADHVKNSKWSFTPEDAEIARDAIRAYITRGADEADDAD